MLISQLLQHEIYPEARKRLELVLKECGDLDLKTMIFPDASPEFKSKWKSAGAVFVDRNGVELV